MNNINELFFSLIRAAIGTQDTLPYAPSTEEWMELYAMAKKQSLVGIAFAGLQRLGASPLPSLEGEGVEASPKSSPKGKDFDLEPCEVMAKYWNMPEMLYLKWMGMAAKIQQRNEIVNKRCVQLQKMLANEGVRSCILKGQGVAALYRHHENEYENENIHSEASLSMLRQSGDIDVWVQNRSIEELAKYVKGFGIRYKATAAHVECKPFEDTEVELHADPAFFRNFLTNRKLVQWFNDSKGSIVESELGFNVPTNEFNLVYMMVHMYHHVLFEGLGLRQLMDYYFVLRTLYDNDTFHYDNDNLISTIKSLGMFKFAKGIMWVIAHVFANDKDNHNDNFFLGIEANEKYGKLILADVMTGGNFGHHDEKNKGLHGGTAISRSMNGLKRNMKFFALGPWEIMSTPLWSTWHYFWRKKHGLL